MQMQICKTFGEEIKSLQICYRSARRDREELRELEKRICQIAKEIFYQLGNLGEIFLLDSQSVWTARPRENKLNDYYSHYEKLIELQNKVRRHLRTTDDMFDIPLNSLYFSRESQQLVLSDESSDSEYSESSSHEISEFFADFSSIAFLEIDPVQFPHQTEEIRNVINSSPFLLKIAQDKPALTWLCSLLGDNPVIANPFSCTAIYQQLAGRVGNKESEKLEKGLAASILSLIEEASWVAFTENRPFLSFKDEKMNQIFDAYKPNDVNGNAEFRRSFQTNGFFIPQEVGSIHEQHYCFHHSTLQEFFAACYLKKALLEKPEKVLKMLTPLVSNPKYELIFSFLAGLLKDDQASLDHLFSILDNQEKRIGFYSLQLKIRCLEECNLPATLNKKAKYVGEIHSCCEQIMNPGLWQLIKKPLLKVFANSPQCSSDIFFVSLKRALKQTDREVKKNALQAISLLQLFNLKEIAPLIGRALQDKAPEVREVAVYALSKMSHEAFRETLSTFGFNLDKDPSPIVRGTLAWALGQNEVYQFGISMTLLLSLLTDPVQAVSLQAMRSLCNKQKDISNDEVESLKELYNASSTRLAIKKKILNILGAWGRGITLIEKALYDWNLRNEAIEAIIFYKLPMRVIGQLLGLLKHLIMQSCFGNSWIEKKLVPDLIRLGKQKEENSQFIIKEIGRIANQKEDWIQNSLSQIPGQNFNIHLMAPYLIQIMGELGENDIDNSFMIIESITERVGQGELIKITTIAAIAKFCRDLQFKGIPYLKMSLQSEYETVQVEAIQAIGSFAATLKNNSKELLEMILPKLENPSAKIRKATIDGLGLLGIHFFEKLYALLKDKMRIEKDPTVRNAIIEAIVKIGRNSSTQASAIVHLILEWGSEILTDDEKNIAAQAVFEGLGQAIQHDLSMGDSQLLEKCFYGWLHHSHAAVKINAIKILPKWKRSLEQVVAMLEIPLLDEQQEVKKASMQALAQLPEGIKLKSDSMAILTKAITEDSTCREEAYQILNRLDLSAYADLMYTLMKSQAFYSLNGTPFSKLIECYSAVYKTSESKKYLLAIMHKCCAENQELFVHDGFLCAWEDGQLKKLIKKGKIDLKQAERHYQNQCLEWRAESLENSAYSQAGHYYRKAGLLEKMIICYERGQERLKEIKNEYLEPSYKEYPELAECLGAVCSLGICYQTGIKLIEGRLENAIRCYIQGVYFNHPLSGYLYALCCEYGVGVKTDPNLIEKVQHLSIELPFLPHVFHLSAHPYILDKESCIPPLGTIGLAVTSLEATAIDLRLVIDYMNRKIRPDYQLVTAFVENDKVTGDLVILLPENLAQNQQLVEKCLQLGLIGEAVNESRQCGNDNRLYTIRFVVPEADIERFLRDELHLTHKVYRELMDMRKRS